MAPSNKTWQIAGLVIAAAASIVLTVMFLRERTQNLTFRTQSEVVQIAQNAMSEMMFTLTLSRRGDKPLSFPRGGIREFTSWMMEPETTKEYTNLATYTDSQSLAFVDCWGQDLVYRFPPRRKGILLELYSVGPNGVDDGGKGDDITADAGCSFAKWKENFEDGIADTDSLWANLDRLEWRPSKTHSGRHIGIGEVVQRNWVRLALGKMEKGATRWPGRRKVAG